MRKTVDVERILSLCEPVDCGIFSPPMDAQTALNELKDYFLGEDWYDASGNVTTKQVNTNIVYEIERRYKGAKISKKKNKTKTFSQFTELKNIDVDGEFQLGIIRYKKISNYTRDSNIRPVECNCKRLDNGNYCYIPLDKVVRKIIP